MAAIYKERAIQIIRFSVRPYAGGTAVDFYFARDYYAANALYSGSPECHPLLVSNVTIRREVSVVTEKLANATVQLHGLTSFGTLGETLQKRTQTYDFQSGNVYAYLFVDGESALSLRRVYVVRQRTFEVNSGEFSFNLRPRWVVDKELSKKITRREISTIDDRTEGEYGPIIFGQGTSGSDNVLIDALFIDTDKVFTGWTTPDHKMNAATIVYGKVRDRSFTVSDHLTVNLPTNPSSDRIGTAQLSSLSDHNMYQYDVMLIDSVSSSGAEYLAEIRLSLKIAGTVTEETGRFECLVYKANGTIPDGRPLARSIIDPSTLTTSYQLISIPFEDREMILLDPSNNYCFVLSWSNKADTTNYPIVGYAAGASTYYTLDKSTDSPGWVAQSAVLQLAVRTIGQNGGSAWNHGDDIKSFLTLLSPADVSPDMRVLPLKIGLKGLEDDSSGSFTGSASSLMQNAADILNFVIQDGDLGLGHSWVDTTSFEAARDDLNITPINNIMGRIDQKTTCLEFILNVCRHCHLRFYTGRNSDFFLSYSKDKRGIDDFRLHQRTLRDDLRVEALSDAGVEFIVNDIEQEYAPDVLNHIDIPDVLRKIEARKYGGKFRVGSTDMTELDQVRADLALVSITKYERREFRRKLEFFDNQEAASFSARKTFDRFHQAVETVTVRILAKDYFDTLDMFDYGWIRHVDLSSESVTSEFGRERDTDFDEMAAYDDGVTETPISTGFLEGEITAFEERGPFIYVTITEVNPQIS